MRLGERSPRDLPFSPVRMTSRKQASWSGVRSTVHGAAWPISQRKSERRPCSYNYEALREPTLRVDEETLVQQGGSNVLLEFLEEEMRRGENPPPLSDWDTFEDAARQRDEGEQQFIRRFKCNCGYSRRSGLAL